MIKCDVCHFINPDGFAYCGRCGNGMVSGGSEVETFSTALEGERKQVTVIFADISGFTALNDAAKTPEGIEQVLQIVNLCLDRLSEVVYNYDGYIDKFMGDAIMALFGAPRTHENDPERALRAALDMMNVLEEFNRNPPFPLAEPLGIHMGINTGTVIAGLIGTRRKRAYTAMGDVVNVASRLEGVSERGEILVSQDTYHLTNRLFVFKDRNPVFVKGKKDALRIHELVDVRRQRASQRGIAGLYAPMVGRDREFDTLRQQITNLRAGRGGVTIVVGEAGLGKSRLISELYQLTTREDPVLSWFEGRGLSFQQNVSYNLFIDILRDYLGVSPEDPGEVIWRKWLEQGEILFGPRKLEVTPYLATVMGIKLPEEITQTMFLSDSLIFQQRILLAIGEWAEAVVQQKPLVLVFEDLHWADPNSVKLIEYLMTLPPRLPLLLICITRPDTEVEFWPIKENAARYYTDHLTELNLAPLTQDQSRFLVDRLLQIDQLPTQLEQLILSRSEGNPLFMEEVLRSLIEDETLVKEGDTWVLARPITEIDIPETLNGVLTARIDRLDESVKRTLQIAAVIGRVFHRSVVAAIVDEPDQLDEHLAPLMTAQLIRERPSEGDQEFIFKHVLVREAAYNTLLLQQRRAYHHQIADHLAPLYWMRGEEYARTIAHHYEQAGSWKRALTYQIRAAEASKNAFDITNAVQFYTTALQTAARIDDLKNEKLIEIYEGRGNLLKRQGKINEARADFEQVLQLAAADHDQVTQLQALGELGKLHDGYEGFSQAAEYFERALTLARVVEDQASVVDTLNQLTDFHFNMGQLDPVERYVNEALEIAQELGNTQRLTSSQNNQARLLLYQGRLGPSIERFRELYRTWHNLGYYQGLIQTTVALADAYSMQADYANSNATCNESLEILERFGDLNWVPHFRFFLAQNAFNQGDLAAAEANISQMIETADKLGKQGWQAVGRARRGYYHLFRGEIETALPEIQQAVEIAEAIGSPLWTSRVKLVQGVAHRFNHNLPEAIAILENVCQALRQMGYIPDEVIALSDLIEVYLIAEEWDKVRNPLARLTNLAESSGMRMYQAKALWFLAQLTAHADDPTTTEAVFQRAVALVRETGDVLVELAITTSLAQMQAAHNKSEQAEASFDAAKRLYFRIADTVSEPSLPEDPSKTDPGRRLEAVRKVLHREKV